jgi:hypothetical protein
VARGTGLEPVTTGLENRCSIQLSYPRENRRKMKPARPFSKSKDGPAKPPEPDRTGHKKHKKRKIRTGGGDPGYRRARSRVARPPAPGFGAAAFALAPLGEGWLAES